ncbi:MAG: hypothetical protein AB9891_16640 [Anaerolineaceae bacterium]
MLPDLRVRQRDYLLEIARGLAGELNLNKLLDRILEISIEMLAGQAGLIVLRSSTSGDWRLGSSKNTTAAFLKMVEPLLAGHPRRCGFGGIRSPGNQPPAQRINPHS